MRLHANHLYIQPSKIMTTLADRIDFGTCRLNEKVITKPERYFEQLQYATHILKIEISVLHSNTLALFQLFFLN